MIVFGLDIYDFEYAYRMDGPNVPEKGLIYDKTKVLLDPYARAVTQQSIWEKSPTGRRVIMGGWCSTISTGVTPESRKSRCRS